MDTIRVIRNPRFAKLWGSQGLSLIAQNLLNFALINRVYELAQGTRFANLSVALLILSFGIPSIFFAAAAGVYVDSWDRRKVMVVTNCLRAFLVLGYLAIEHNLVLVLLLTFTISSITQFFAPAESAAIPRLVDQEELLPANSVFVFTLYASFIIGYSASAPVLRVAGPAGPYLLTCVMFAIATVLDLLLPKLPPTVQRKVSVESLYRRTVRELRTNWHTIKDNHNLYFPIIQLSISQSVLGIVLALAPALSLALLLKPLPEVSQFLVIPAGLGMVLGVLAVGGLIKRFAKLVVVVTGMVAAGATLTLLGLTGQLHRTIHGHPIAELGMISWLVAILALLLGAINAIVASSSQTILQENSPDEDRGKIFGALLMMINISATVPVFLAGVLADAFSPTKVIDAVGGMVFLFAVLQAIYLEFKGYTGVFKKTS